MKILFATSEVTPLIKTGGLADVSGALPEALRSLGDDVRVLVPGYKQVMDRLGRFEIAATMADLPGFPEARLLAGLMPNAVPLYVLDCPGLFMRDGGPYQDTTGYDWADNGLRFGMLSKVAAILGSNASPLDWHPDLLHCNDWQTGLAPAYLHFIPDAAPCVLSIHNLAFQGIFPQSMVEQLGLPASCYSIEGLEYYGNMSFLKAGLYYSDHITTVSPNYAKEIQQETLGFGLQGLLATRQNKLTGILNGIDTREWDPATDRFLAKSYDSENLNGKAANKKSLQISMGLDVNPDIPVLGVVSRLTHQKGLDVLLEIVPRLMDIPVQLVILGSGDAQMQMTASKLPDLYPGQIGVMIGFSEERSHQIEAGADIFVMPSRFEPCGLNQFYSQRYGTLPVVHATGGLADSVVDCTQSTITDGTASGFSFDGMTTDNLFETLLRAIDLYRNNKPVWHALQKNCMTKDLSWPKSAEAYQAVYRKVIGK